MDRNAKIHVAGADTMLGKALVRVLQQDGYERLVSDLAGKPEYVFVAAGPSGGIGANQRFPADLCRENLRVALDLIPAAYAHGVKKLLYLASSCIYPKHCPQPMAVEALGTGPLEPTSAAYATAKLSGLALCQAYRQQYGANFISAIPADVFGPGTKFSSTDSHVVPSLMVKMLEAKQAGLEHVTLWGSGNPRREFSFADDVAEACLLVMRTYDREPPINLGAGEAVSIRALAELIREIVGYTGEIRWDHTRPDGAPIKLLDSTVLRSLGWRPATALSDALRLTFDDLTRTRCQ